MTRAQQISSEIRTVTELLGILGYHLLPQPLKPPEPDCYVILSEKQIGIEVTRYHISSERKKFEESWDKLIEPFHERASNQLPPLSIIFDLIKHKTPNPAKERDKFINEVIEFLKLNLSKIGTDFVDFRNFDPEEFPLMNKYVKEIAAHLTKYSFELRCDDVTTGGVGVEERELLEIISKKESKPTKYKGSYDEIWLLIAGGEGVNLSSQLGTKFHYTVHFFRELSEQLTKTSFERIYVFNDIWGYPVCEWRRGTGWTTLKGTQ